MENRLIKAVSGLAFTALVLSACGIQTEINHASSSLSESSFISNSSSESSKEENIFSEIETSSETLDSSSSSDENSEIQDKPSVKPPYIPSDDELVMIKDYIPTIKFDIRYATENNFTGQIIYENSDAYLRYGTVKKLMAVQEELEAMGLSLLIWDAYRPTEAQEKLWDICPDPNFVSDPKNGFSGHCRGGAIDITIVTSDGTLLEMPSIFDEFTPLADRDYSDVSETAAQNSQMLEDIMLKHGFSGYRKEWWHYSDTTKYDVVGQEK